MAAATVRAGAPTPRRRVAWGFWCLGLSLLLSACSPPSTGDDAANELVTVDMCLSSQSGTQAVVAYALEKGIFVKHGLNVRPVIVNGGSRAAAALISGSVQLCHVAGPAVAHAIVAGAELRVVGALITTHVYSLMVEPGVESASELRGRAVAVSAPGSASDTAMRAALRRLGLRDGEVTILAIGSEGERMAALEAKYVAGTLLSFPEKGMAQQKGFRPLLDVSALNLPTLHSAVVTSTAFLQDHRPVVLNFMKGITESIARLKRDKPGVIAILGRKMGLDPVADAAALDETFEILLKEKLQDVPVPSLEVARAVLGEIAFENPAAVGFPPEDLIDASIGRELESSGFFSSVLDQP